MSPVLTSPSHGDASTHRTHRGVRAVRPSHGSPAFETSPSTLTTETARARLAHVLFVEVPQNLQAEPRELTPFPVARTYQRIKLTLAQASVARLQAHARGDADTADLASLANFVLRELLSWRSKPTAHDYFVDRDHQSHRVAVELSDWDIHTIDTVVQTVRRELNIFRSARAA